MLFELILEGTYFGKSILNRWNYLASGTPAAVSRSFALVSAFGGIYDLTAIPIGYPANSPLGLMMGMLANDFVLTQVSALAVYDVVDFYQSPFVQPYVGAASAEAMSPATAYGYRTNRVRRDIGRGFKRIAGVTEEAFGNGGIVVAGYLSDMNDVADAWSEVLTYDDEGNTLSFAPVVVGKQKYNPATGLPSDDGTAYRYYPTLAEQIEHLAEGIQWSAMPSLRTQRSRQY